MIIEAEARKLSHENIVSLLSSHIQLSETNTELTNQVSVLSGKLSQAEQELAWFKKQIFGTKSEKRGYVPDPKQMALGEILAKAPVSEVEPGKREVKSYKRGTAKKKPLEGAESDTGLRFGPDVPVKEIMVPNPELEGLNEDEYEIVKTELSHKLAQLPGSHIVLKYVTQTAKIKESGKMTSPPAPPAVLEKSFADVSLLAGVLIDKIQYHIPLYRQHQRLGGCGIVLSRATLMNYFNLTAELLSPIYNAQLESILRSAVICMDETPIKVSKSESGGKGMKTSYYWPVYGDKDEICFEWHPSRKHRYVAEILKEYQGILLTDGYKAYEKYADANEGVTRAQCWSHARRKFVDALKYDPELANIALDYISILYENERYIKENKLNEKEKMLYRLEHSKATVEEFFYWLDNTLCQMALLPTGSFTVAANYTLGRREQLKVFLQNPSVQIDTNHEEREIRSIAMGRKNWNFCWTEVGAKHVGIIQSIIRTCLLNQVNPYQYLVDVLQRISIVKQQDVQLLTPRLWKENFQQVRFKAFFEG